VPVVGVFFPFHPHRAPGFFFFPPPKLLPLFLTASARNCRPLLPLSLPARKDMSICQDPPLSPPPPPAQKNHPQLARGTYGKTKASGFLLAFSPGRPGTEMGIFPSIGGIHRVETGNRLLHVSPSLARPLRCVGFPLFPRVTIVCLSRHFYLYLLLGFFVKTTQW